MDSTAKRKLGTVGTVFIVIGVIVFVIAIIQATQPLIVLQTWKPVQAEVVNTAIANEKVNVTIQTARADNYLVTWTFRYNVGGTSHTATADPGSHGSYAEMEKWSNRFDKGQQVTIHHKPDNPDVISAAAYDWITFSHAARTAGWGIGIILIGFILRRVSRA